MSTMTQENVKHAQEKFGALIENESKRIQRMKESQELTDFKNKEKIVVGIMPGDGVGPILMEQAPTVCSEENWSFSLQ